MPVKAASDSVGAQMSMMRKRSKKVCENPECRTKFTGLAVARFCSDECRFRGAYLRAEAEEEAKQKAAVRKKRAKEVVRRVRL